MAKQTLKLNVKTGEKNGKNYSNDRSQVLFTNQMIHPEEFGGLIEL